MHKKTYLIDFKPGWDKFFSKLDKGIQKQIWKKIQKQKNETQTRHLKHGINFYVVEVNQNRIIIKINEVENKKTIHFIGNHKQYEKWLKEIK